MTCLISDAGRLEGVTDDKNQVISYSYTKIGNKESITYSNGKKVTYQYDKAENLVKVVDNNKVTTYTYDKAGNITTKTLPNGMDTNYTYNDNGHLIKQEEVKGSVVKETLTLDYDQAYNVIRKEHREGGSNNRTTYTYDAIHQLTSVRENNGVRNYGYDEFNNRSYKEEVGDDYNYESYLYDGRNQLIATFSSQDTKTYDNDTRGNLVKVAENGETKETYEFDGTGGLSKSVVDGNTTEYTYNGLGNRVLVTTKNGNAVTSKKEYVYDVTSTYQDIIEVVDTKEVENKLTSTHSIFVYGTITLNRYTYGNNNPVKYTDPSGNVALLTLIARASAGALADYLMQATMNFFFNPATQFNLQ